MCGRARCTLRREQAAAAAGVPPECWRDAEAFQPTENMHPGMRAPVVKEDYAGKRDIQTMRWGLVPSFTKAGEKPDFFRMFNARCESVAEKPVFSRLLKSHRCVAILDGFFEWKQEGTRKTPYYISFGRGRTMKMAGLYDCWRDDEGNSMYSFTILTTDSSKRLQWLHNRMPVILRDEGAEKAWLHNGELPDSKVLQHIYEPYNEDDLVWHPVTPKMSSMAYQGADAARDIRRQGLGAFFKPQAKSMGPTPGAHDSAPTKSTSMCDDLPNHEGGSKLGAQGSGGSVGTGKSKDGNAPVKEEPASASGRSTATGGKEGEGLGAGSMVGGAGGVKLEDEAGVRAELGGDAAGHGNRQAVQQSESSEDRGMKQEEEEAARDAAGRGTMAEEAAAGAGQVLEGGPADNETGLTHGAEEHSPQEGLADTGHGHGSHGKGAGPHGQKRGRQTSAATKAASTKKAKMVSPGTGQSTLHAFFTKNPL